MTDSERLADPEGAIRRLPRGLKSRLGPRFKAAVIVRARDNQTRAALARRLAPLCRERGVALMISNDLKLARTLSADGVHFPEEAARRGTLKAALTQTRRARRPYFVTTAAHNEIALRRGLSNAHAVLFAPVFATLSHPGAPSLGVLRFATFVRKMHRNRDDARIVALGGVTAARANRLVAAGADGFAAVGALA